MLAPVVGWGSQEQLIKQGEYVLRIAGCAGCHTDVDRGGASLAGGRAISTPFGAFYSPNITPDRSTGIGAWSDEDFIRALTEGISPDGRHYYPVFPYTSYTRMRKTDIRALKAYLFTVSPVVQPNKTHDLPWYMSSHYVNWVWKFINFYPGEYQPQVERTDQWNRGAYLATALAHCAECHSPRNFLGALDPARLNAGTQAGPDNEVVPNITADKKTGIGRWSQDDLVYFLETGATPEGDYTGSLMAEVIDEGLRYLTPEDRKSIALYIRTLPPIEHAVKRKKKKQRNEFDY